MEFSSLAGETLYGLAKQHDLSRNLIRIGIAKHEAGALDSDTAAADMLAEYDARIAALERLVGKLALEYVPRRRPHGPADCREFVVAVSGTNFTLITGTDAGLGPNRSRSIARSGNRPASSSASISPASSASQPRSWASASN